MTVEEYSELQAAITAELVSVVLQFARLFQVPALSVIDWERLLDVLFPYVDDARTRSAELGRRFYDSQRAIYSPNQPVQPVNLAAYRREWFSEAMFPAQYAMMRPGATPSAVAEVALRAAKEVENGARRTIIRAVPEDREVKGWARVATGRETCGFCLMLVSRGPVYESEEDADGGFNDAIDLLHSGDANALDELKNRWHPGCDCKVVPVFDRQSWPGRDAYLAAQRLWGDVTKGYTGKDKFDAFRRYVESGDNDVSELTIAA